jgi:hypothetical protein
MSLPEGASSCRIYVMSQVVGSRYSMILFSKTSPWHKIW